MLEPIPAICMSSLDKQLYDKTKLALEKSSTLSDEKFPMNERVSSGNQAATLIQRSYVSVRLLTLINVKNNYIVNCNSFCVMSLGKRTRDGPYIQSQ